MKKHSVWFLLFSILLISFNIDVSLSADLIDPEEQYKLGLQYLNGDGVKQSIIEAAIHIQIAALQGHSDAQALYGDMFYSGNGVIQNKRTALDWYKKAAEGGSINGFYGLGQWYELEDGTEKNVGKAIDLYRKAAEAGHAKAQYSLAEHYYTGDYIEKDIDECLKWASASAAQNNDQAQYLLGIIFLNGENTSQNLEEAFKWLQASSDQGNDKAQVQLGLMYESGNGVDQDYAAAASLFQKAAEQQNSDGFYFLAECYDNGYGVEADKLRACELYKAAAVLGKPEAQYKYGSLLLEGIIIDQNRNEAATWLKQATDQGYKEASDALYTLLHDGYIVKGKLYSFDEKSQYGFSTSNDYTDIADSDDSYGLLVLNGKISNHSDETDIPSYDVGSGNVDISYRYVYDLLNAPESEWHLINDRSKKIDSLTVNKNINKGAVILQTSPDGENWTTVRTITNTFSDTPVQTEPLYTSSQIQLSNGCYYRLIVAYELQKNDGTKSTKKQAEVYDFYMFNSNKPAEDKTIRKQRIDADKKRVETTQGYMGEQPIVRGDPHYGWDLGSFYVSGFTSSVKDDKGNPVFLKNVGDKVTLWFSLDQKIDALPAKDKEGKELQASIHNDNNSDNYFETERINFGRGAVITRFTDHNGDKGKPVIYSDFLGANASKNADTQVTLFEEGDYEVALDYAIKTEPRKVLGLSVIPEYSHYRMFFRFSVRNGNCMVYPFDIVTGAELTNTSVTENGFYLDLARSRYLDINVKKEVITEGANGFVEDIRFNRPARDGESYEDEGLYTITATNKYTNQSTQKIIYVGTNDILSNYVSSGLTVDEIIKALSNGNTN